MAAVDYEVRVEYTKTNGDVVVQNSKQFAVEYHTAIARAVQNITCPYGGNIRSKKIDIMRVEAVRIG